MSKYHKTDREISDAINDGVCTFYTVEKRRHRWHGGDVWIVYSGVDGVKVEAYECDAKGVRAVAHTVLGLVSDTAAKTYQTKAAAVAAVRRAETANSKYIKVAVRGDRVYVW